MIGTIVAERARPRLPSGRVLAADLSIAGFTAALLGPGLAVGPTSDPAVFILVGNRIRQGGLPFKDVWDHKPPGAALLNAGLDAVLPWLNSWLLCWLMSFAFTAIALVLVHHLLRRRVSGGAALVWTLLAATAVASFPVALGGGDTEQFALLPLALALWLVDGIGTDEGGAIEGAGSRRAALIGVLLAAACLLTLQSVPAAVAGLAAVVAGPDLRQAVRRGLALAGGGLILPGLVAVWLAASGAMPAAFDQLVTYAAAYRQASHGFPTAMFMGLYSIAGLIVPTLVFGLRLLVRPSRGGRLEWLCLAWVVGYALLIAYENRFYFHYMIPVIPPLAILAATSFRQLLSEARSSQRMARRVGFAVVASTVVLTSTGLLFQAEATAFMTLEASTLQGYRGGAAEWIKANTSPGDRVFIWANYPEIHLMTDRPNYGPYLYEFPMSTPGYWSPARTQEMLAGWVADPPEIIVQGESDVPLFGKGMHTNDGRDYDTLDPLRVFVYDHYRLGTRSGVLAVWVLDRSSERAPSASAARHRV